MKINKQKKIVVGIILALTIIFPFISQTVCPSCELWEVISFAALGTVACVAILLW